MSLLFRSLALPLVLQPSGRHRRMRNRLFPTLNRKFASVPQRVKLSVYQGVGHSPFFEDAPRFNAELAAFVRGAHKAN